MRRIELTQNKFALVDNEDYERLNGIKWYYSNGYAVHSLYKNGKFSGRLWMHRLIMNTPTGMEVDHKNGNGIDNRKSNLRNCHHFQNVCNTKLQKRSKSGYKGVTWSKKKKKWIVMARQKFYLGAYDNPKKAAQVYDNWARKNYKEFARLNFN